MKVINKTVRKKEHITGEKEGRYTKVLDLEYSHKGETGRILVADYMERLYPTILKQLRIEVKELYNKTV